MENYSRREPPEVAGEGETLKGFLDYFQATVVMKAGGLSDADDAKRPVPSLTTVSGLVQHLTDVERFWSQYRIDGQQGVPIWWTAENPDASSGRVDPRFPTTVEAIIRQQILRAVRTRAGKLCG